MEQEKNNTQLKSVLIIGSGIGGMSLACMLSKKGHSVTVLEKNEQTGGRARVFSENGFRFDMGPSWYMMPDIFEHFFDLVGENINDYYSLQKLNPSYQVTLKSDKKSHLFYSDLDLNKKTFEALEPGSAAVLEKFLEDTKKQYEISYNEFLFKNYDSFFDFINLKVMKEGRNLPLFKSQKKIIQGLFHTEVLQKVMQYQTVLLGTSPADTPGIYSLMNYVDMVLGEWYPSGGIRSVPLALEKIARKNGAEIITNSEVKKININEEKKAYSVTTTKNLEYFADIIVSNGDIANTDRNLLDERWKIKSEKYWQSRKLAPSAFIMYLGVKGKLPELQHHNLLFSKDWDNNFKEIFDQPKWPTDPSLYICMPSKVDPTVAPENHENLFVLVPVASGLNDSEPNFLDNYKNKVLDDISENYKISNLKERVIYQKIYSISDFSKDYNAFKGTALGLAHTLKQTAFFRPNNMHPKVKNLFYVGAGTNPGIGMPICLISAELVYKRIHNIKDNKPISKI